jgi:hypothetical protein
MTPSREVKAAATLAERERIIKLIHENSGHLCNNESGLLSDFVESNALIALIKGDNK